MAQSHALKAAMLALCIFCVGNAADAPGVEDSLSATVAVPKEKKADPPWGRDIFAPLVRHAAALDLRLTAVFYNAQRPSALINGTIVYRGSLINGQKVIDIGKTHVILHGELGEVRLEIAVAAQGAGTGAKR